MSKHLETRRAALVRTMLELAKLEQTQAASMRAFGKVLKAKLAELERVADRLETADGRSHDYSYPDPELLLDPDDLEAEARSWLELAASIK